MCFILAEGVPRDTDCLHLRSSQLLYKHDHKEVLVIVTRLQECKQSRGLESLSVCYIDSSKVFLEDARNHSLSALHVQRVP